MGSKSDDDANASFLKGPLLKQGRLPHNSLETYDKDWRLGGQVIGYRTAAKLLIDAYLERRGSLTLLHPILYLYRHSIELHLKRLIARFDGEWPGEGHNLSQLWKRTNDIIGKYISVSTDDLGKLLSELHSVDPHGMTFRYPTDRKQTPIEISLSEIDVEHLKVKMEEIEVALSGLETMLEQALETMAEAGR